MKRVLLVGLGRMGLPIARHLIEHGFEVHGHDLAQVARNELVGLGGLVANFPEVAAESDFVVVMVGHEDQVEQLLLEPGGLSEHCSDNTVVIVMSTISPVRLEAIASQPPARRLRILDVPVCRGDVGAASGGLLALVSGTSSDFNASRELLEAFCSDIFYLGERLGVAQVAKSVNDMILWAAVVANYEGFSLAESWGIGMDQLRPMLEVSTGDNWAARHWERREHWPWSIKDMRIFTELAKQGRLDLPLANTIEQEVATLPILHHA